MKQSREVWGVCVVTCSGWLLINLAGCSAPSGSPDTDTIASVQQSVTGGGLSSSNLQLQVLTNSCGTNQVQQFFKVVNAGATPVRASDIKIKFWIDDTSISNIVPGISTGGCLTNAAGCFHNVTGVTAAVAPVTPACGPDAHHQANREITVSSTDNTLLGPGQSWINAQLALHLANYGNFNPGTSYWYSGCLSGGTYKSDSHFAVYYQNQLVFASGVSAPDCRAPHGTQQLSGHITAAMRAAPLVGPVPGNTPVVLSVGLPVQNLAALKSFVQDVSNPNSPQYRHYITPDTFAATYGPLPKDYQDLTTWALSKVWRS